MEKHVDWCHLLGWKDEQLDDLRTVAYAYIRQGKYEIAKAFFEALTILQPDQPYDLQTLGALYLQMGNPVKALPFLDRAIKLEADHEPTLLNLTKTFLLLNKKDEALRLAKVLSDSKDVSISNVAKALLLAYS